MALGVAWDVARSGLSVASDQMSVVSRNVSNAQNPDATRKIAETVARPGGGSVLASIGRVASQQLLDTLLKSNSDAEAQTTALSGADRLAAIISDPELGTSPAAQLAKLRADLLTFAARPSDLTVGRTVIATADGVARSLNSAARVVSSVRDDTDKAIGQSVANINSLLSKLEVANASVLKRIGQGDASEVLDGRDAILKQLSAEIGIRVVLRADNDVLVYTDGGAVLFETVARTVAFNVTSPLTPGAPGGQIYIDGIPASGPGSPAPIESGRLKGLLDVRDYVAPTFAAQLDETARGLIEAFADADRIGGGNPMLPGLFTWSGGTVPATGSLIDGLAGDIRVNPGVDPRQGGDVRRLRDGGASAPGNPAYVANSSGAAGYSARLDELVTGLTNDRAFALEAGLATSSSLIDQTAASAGWIESIRKSVSEEKDARDALRSRAAASLSSATGVNIDREMADMLHLERAYQASSRLITTVDAMYDALFSAMR